MSDEGFVHAVLRVTYYPSDHSWGITDDTRPGFVTAANSLQAALRDVPTVLHIWDEAAHENRVKRVSA